MWCCAVVLAFAPPIAPSSAGGDAAAPPGQAPASVPAPTTAPDVGNADAGVTPSSAAPAPTGANDTTGTATTLQDLPPAPAGEPLPSQHPVLLDADGDRRIIHTDTDPTRFHFNGRATLATGVGGFGRIDVVSFGDPKGDRRSHGYLVETTGAIAPFVRAVGYAERRSKSGKQLFFLLPDIALTFQLGGSRVGRDAVATANNHEVYRSGTYIGMFGHANFSGGVATPGRFGVYGKGSIGARYLLGGAGREGAFGMFPMGIGAGLRVGLRPDLTILVGPKLEGVLGVHGIDNTPPSTVPGQLATGSNWHPVGQMVVGGDLVVQARTKRNVYVSLLGTADVTAVGRTYGGQRIFGRSTIDVAIPMTPALRLAVFATYTGWRATAAPNSPPFAPEGQTWNNHTFVLGLGVGL